tara:strand:- start:965 stop:1129 length:165 start_codon:yes stop_codon:yes gene_type:complete
VAFCKISVIFDRAGNTVVLALFGVIVFEVWESLVNKAEAKVASVPLADAPGADR